MSSKVLLQAEKRTVLNTVENKRARKKGLVPAIVFGKTITSVPVMVKGEELRKVVKKHGRNAVIELNVNGDKPYPVIIKNITYQRILGGYEHIDFQNVSMSDEIKSEVGLKIIGREMIESKRLVLIRQMDTIKIKGLPDNIPDSIEINVTNMDAGSTLTISDITFPEGITPDEDSDTLVLSVNAVKAEHVNAEDSEENE